MILNEVWLYMSDVYLHDRTSRPHPLHVYSHVFVCFHEVDSFIIIIIIIIIILLFKHIYTR